MAWWKDQVWEQGLAVVLVVVGAALVWWGAGASGSLDGIARWGAVLLSIGIAMPIGAQLGLRERFRSDRTEDV